MDREAAAIITQSKSVGTAVVLTLLFGGLGLLYASVKGGIIMLIIDVICVVLMLAAVGFFLLPLSRVIAVVIAVKAVQGHNQRLVARPSLAS